jgi:hypothetical protein
MDFGFDSFSSVAFDGLSSDSNPFLLQVSATGTLSAAPNETFEDVLLSETGLLIFAAEIAPHPLGG